MSSPRMLVIFTFATAVVVGGIASLVVGSWWLLLAAMVLHALGTVLVVGVIFRATEQQDKPDPATEARVEQEAAEPEGGPAGAGTSAS
jgi:membrane protein implicated in regulation of membrane protease activity